MEQLQHKYSLMFGAPLMWTDKYGNEATVVNSITDSTTPLNISSDLVEYTEKKEIKKGKTSVTVIAESTTYLLEDHNIKFTITMSSKPDSNKAKILIYNAPPELEGRLDSMQGTGMSCVLKAGYESETTLPILFEGLVENSSTSRSGGDIITEVLVSDSGKNFRQAYFSKKYKKGTPIDSIFIDMIRSLKISIGALQKTGKVTKKAVQYSGATIELIRKLSLNHKMLFSVQNGKAFMCSEKSYFSSSAGQPPLTFTNGLKTRVRPYVIKVNAKEKDKDKNRKGYSFRCSLRPDLFPCMSVEVDDGFREKATYRIYKVKHYGEYEGNDWFSDISAVEADPIE